MRWMTMVLVLGLTARAEASFFPGDGPRASTSISEKGLRNFDKAYDVLQSFEAEMSSLVSPQGARLRLVLELEDPKVNAQALREDQNWLIVVYGGLAGHPKITAAELTLVLCHELGHHLGGTPTAARNGWSACEGQADYWSTLSCFKKLRPKDDAVQVALRLTEMYAAQGMQGMPEVGVRDTARPVRTHFGYPSAQCRLDTMLAGLLGEPRPRCWYVAD